MTRWHVHVDRVACPWLMTRFVDSEAELLYVPPSRIAEVVQESRAIPFDAPGVEMGHHEGRCSCESIMLKCGLKAPGLLKPAKIVHAADTNEGYDQEPVGYGLERDCEQDGLWPKTAEARQQERDERWKKAP